MRWTYEIEELEEQRLVIVLDSYKYLIYYVLYSKD
jgi:hypothetical protein